MPLYKSIEVNSQTNVKIWHIKESIDQLKSKTELKDENLNRLSSMKSDIRKKEFLSVRLLLKSFGFSDYDLTYNDSGKPILKNGCFISITHSFDYSAVAISNFPIGIDIEKSVIKF
jgi:phosphopantetheinyl transferase